MNPEPTKTCALGRILKRWRAQRRLSQLQLAERASISARHLSFLETGRAVPSREMALRLADALDLPLAERNGLLVAGGYAPVHSQQPLDSLTMQRIRSILERLLAKQEPYPAVAFDRGGNLVLANQALYRLFQFLGGPSLVAELKGGPELNLVVATFHPKGLRPFIVNWKDAARTALRRLQRDAEALGGDPRILALLAEVQQLPDMPTDWLRLQPQAEVPCLTFTLERDGQRLTWLSTITTFGSPQDITLQGMQIESFFPADDSTEQLWVSLADSAVEPSLPTASTAESL